MKNRSFFIVVAAILISFLLLSVTVFGQSKNKRNSHQDLLPQLQHVSDYFDEHPSASYSDSIYKEAFNYLLNFSTDEVLKSKVLLVQQYIDDNKVNKQLMNLIAFKRIVDSLNQERSRFMADYWHYKELQKNADTISLSSNDSIFSVKMDSLFNDSPFKMDSIFEALSPYNDSLSRSIEQDIEYFSQDAVFKWIKKVRRDTINFYLINLEGDSLLIHMYNNSPELIRFSITDYWGTKSKAVIRDIDKNSMRILVDNTPLVNYETDEKAKEAIGNLGNNFSGERKLTINNRPIEKGKVKWILGGNANVDLAQNYLSESWAKGGESSLSFMTGLELFAIYQKENYTFENRGIFKYGAIRQGGKENFLKATEDRIELVSKYGHKLFKDYFLSGFFNFKSQFATGYEYPNDSTKTPVSKFMSPGYITFALGLDIKSIPKTVLFVSPLTSKNTIVLADTVNETKYGLKPSEKVRSETGAIIKGSYKTKVWGNIEMENYLELFSNYVNNPQNVDIDWDFRLIFPVNDYIRATISTRLIYDDDQLVPKFKDENDVRVPDGTTKAVQFKEYLTIGFAVKF
ncbi:MAG: DUF3078 domain-containing protein [Salinivirgaceae bacterium]|jgi:hypothetical protein